MFVPMLDFGFPEWLAIVAAVPFLIGGFFDILKGVAGMAAGFIPGIGPVVSKGIGAIPGGGGGGSGGFSDIMGMIGQIAPGLISNLTGGAELDPKTSAALFEKAGLDNEQQRKKIDAFGDISSLFEGVAEQENANPFQLKFDVAGLTGNEHGGPLTAEFLQSLQSATDAVPFTAGDRRQGNSLMQAAQLLAGGSGAATSLASLGEDRRTQAGDQLAGTTANVLNTGTEPGTIEAIIAELVASGQIPGAEQAAAPAGIADAIGSGIAAPITIAPPGGGGGFDISGLFKNAFAQGAPAGGG